VFRLSVVHPPQGVMAINLPGGETVRPDIALRSSPSKACLPSLQGWQVSPFIGSATYAYPLEVPAGAGGLRPPLALHYDSAATDGASGMREKQQAGWVGKGWTLDPGGAIALNRVVINLDTASWVDYYALTLNGRAYDLMRQEARAGVSNPDPNNPAHWVWRPTSDAALRIQADWIGRAWEGNPELGGDRRHRRRPLGAHRRRRDDALLSLRRRHYRRAAQRPGNAVSLQRPPGERERSDERERRTRRDAAR
jgi:hypothetical protein